MFPWQNAQEKAKTFASKGDKLFAKKKFRAAYDFYKKAFFFDETSLALCEKLIKVMDEFKDDWSEEDFVENVYWAMRSKELSDPTFKRIHFRAEPEFQAVTRLVQNMLKANTKETETKAVEAIVAYGEKALYPLIEFILTFKNLAQKNKTSPDANKR